MQDHIVRAITKDGFLKTTPTSSTGIAGPPPEPTPPPPAQTPLGPPPPPPPPRPDGCLDDGQHRRRSKTAR